MEVEYHDILARSYNNNWVGKLLTKENWLNLVWEKGIGKARNPRSF